MYALIVESPTKLKTIGKYLGKDYKILSSFGHVRGLPTKKDAIDVKNDFAMHYKLTEQGEKVLPKIVKELKDVKKLYLATDPDREGEAISWHLIEALKEKNALPKKIEVHRITFNEITKIAVLNAIANPREININLVSAQRLRQALDYLVGFTLSPLLWRKLPGSRSAGRVQSVALRVLCDKENDIDSFRSEEYWNIDLDLQNASGEILSTALIKTYGKKLEKTDIKNETQAKKLIEEIIKNKFSVQEIKQKTTKKKPPLPFITSSLQQYASTNFGFSAKKTMMIAQKLYEGVELDGQISGLITYMRTDGIYISADAISDIRNLIKNSFETEYLPKSEIIYKKRVKNAQEAHESIRPSDVSLTPEKAKPFLTEEQFKLYDCIWRRTVASQMTDAEIASEHVHFISADGNFVTTASYSKLVFDGFYKVYKAEKSSDGDKNIAEFFKSIKKGDELDIEKLEPRQSFTQAPPRYSEAGLIKKMEELGIGRPSTYATIISVLQDRNYAEIVNKAFVPQSRGRLVTAFLVEFCMRYVEYNFTAQLEDQLDSVAEGKLDWFDVLREFWQSFSKNVEDVMQIPFADILSVLNKKFTEYSIIKSQFKIGESCLKCKSGKITLNVGKFGVFLGCTNYPECNFTANEGGSVADGGQVDEFPKEISEGVHLHKGPYGLYLKRNGKNFSIPKGIEQKDLTEKLISTMTSLPKILGMHPADGNQIKLGIGPYGSYILYNKRYYSIQAEQIESIVLDDAIELINNAPEKKTRTKTPEKIVADSASNAQFEIFKGPYGYYIKHEGKNLGIGKDAALEDITFGEIEEIIAKKQKSTKKKQSKK